MAEVFISNAARSDLLSIDDYRIDRFGEEAVDALSAGFERVFAQLAEFPRSGPERPEYGEVFAAGFISVTACCIGSKGIWS